jgi:hypothetical protein
MTAQTRPVFTEEWPRYAVVAHVLFWATSALFFGACAAAFFKALPFEVAVMLFLAWVISVSILGIAAACSGKLYRGDQVLSRTPMTGLSARIAGTMATLSALILLVFAYGLTQIGH